jgi:hypothetical protein
MGQITPPTWGYGLSVPGIWVGYHSWLLDLYHDLSFFQGVKCLYVVDEWMPGYPVGSG